ncbi:MAG: flagellar export chaperone FliS [Candidatus Solibacter sp.]
MKTRAMYENPYASSLETKILSATPLELVQLLYQAAIDAVQSARRHLSRGEIAERARSVGKAVEILTELGGSLDHQRGGAISTRLASLYDYLQVTLLDANFQQADDGLEKAETLLKTLNEAWSAIEAPRTGGSMESHPASYRTATSEERGPRAAQQWCA